MNYYSLFQNKLFSPLLSDWLCFDQPKSSSTSICKIQCITFDEAIWLYQHISLVLACVVPCSYFCTPSNRVQEWHRYTVWPLYRGQSKRTTTKRRIFDSGRD